MGGIGRIITIILAGLLICSSNILVDSNYTGKLGDFGFAKQVPTAIDGRSYFSDVTQCGTQGYMAPEILDGEMSTKLDVYSFGVVCIICTKTTFF